MASSLVHLLENAEDISSLHSQAVEEISTGNLKVIELVEGLSSHLTSTDEEKRRQGVSLLSNVIKNLPITHFNEEESDVLARFFCDRLKDRLTIIPCALAGLESISLLKNVSNSVPMEILLALSMNVTAQTLPQSARLTYYGILKNLIFSKTEVLLKNSSDFVYAVISAMDSESDPRCLNYLFHFLPSLLSQFPLNHLAEEAFSVLECYFPVDFNPRDKSDITREDLALGLQDCLTATPAFAPFLIPTILEKLDSQLKVAHLDSLNLLIKGFEVWSLSDIKPHTSDIWKSLSKLLLPPTDNEVADLASKTLIALINAYVESKTIYSELDQLLEDISASTHGFLSDPKLSLFLPTTKLLGAVSMVSEHSCKYVIRTVLKQLLILLEQSSEKDVTLSALTPLLCSSVKFSCWQEDNDVSSILKEVPAKLIQLLSNPKARRGCFASLIEIISLLEFEQRQEVYKLIFDTIAEFSPTDSEMCSNYVKKIGSKYPTEVKENLLVKLNITDNNTITKKHFEIFCWCCQVLELTSYSIKEILNHISSESSTIVIDCLRELCVSADEKVLEIFGKELTVETLYKFALCQECDNLSQDDVTNISKIIQAIIRPLSNFCQQEVVSNCIILHNSFYVAPEKINNTNCSDDGSNTIFPEDDNGLDIGLKWTSNQVFLLEGLLCPLRSLSLVTNFTEIIRGLINSSVSNNNSYPVRDSASRTLASVINKCGVQDFEVTIKAISKAIEKGGQKEVLLLLSWITKSLIMKGSNDANEFLNKLTISLKIKEVQREAAEGFRLILEDHECLSFKNYCNIRILYKQRMFYEISDLIMLLNQTENENNFGILLAVAYILQKVPQSLIISGFNELIPVIVQSIDSNYSEVITVILEVIANLLESREQIFEGYMDTFIPRCLKCVDSSYTMTVRMQALNCLYYYGTYKEIIILPFKERVLAGLIASLDDRKRLVRQRAVRARNRWFLVAALPET